MTLEAHIASATNQERLEAAEWLETNAAYLTKANAAHSARYAQLYREAIQ